MPRKSAYSPKAKRRQLSKSPQRSTPFGTISVIEVVTSPKGRKMRSRSKARSQSRSRSRSPILILRSLPSHLDEPMDMLMDEPMCGQKVGKQHSYTHSRSYMHPSPAMIALGMPYYRSPWMGHGAPFAMR